MGPKEWSILLVIGALVGFFIWAVLRAGAEETALIKKMKDREQQRSSSPSAAPLLAGLAAGVAVGALAAQAQERDDEYRSTSAPPGGTGFAPVTHVAAADAPACAPSAPASSCGGVSSCGGGSGGGGGGGCGGC